MLEDEHGLLWVYSIHIGVSSLHGCSKKQHQHADFWGHVMARRLLGCHFKLRHAACRQIWTKSTAPKGIPEVVHRPHCTLYFAGVQVYSILYAVPHNFSADVQIAA